MQRIWYKTLRDIGPPIMQGAGIVTGLYTAHSDFLSVVPTFKMDTSGTDWITITNSGQRPLYSDSLRIGGHDDIQRVILSSKEVPVTVKRKMIGRYFTGNGNVVLPSGGMSILSFKEPLSTTETIQLAQVLGGMKLELEYTKKPSWLPFYGFSSLPDDVRRWKFPARIRHCLDEIPNDLADKLRYKQTQSEG